MTRVQNTDMIEEDEDEADSDSSESVKTETISHTETFNNSKSMTEDVSKSLVQSWLSNSDLATQKKNTENLSFAAD